jgi:tRNA-splicing ligase RtcB (3'-phosphate/5'-hydroxy nucleic acid ligase)
MNKFTNRDFYNLHINDLELLKTFGRVGNGLLKTERMSKAEVLQHFHALIENPLPYATEEKGYFVNLANLILDLRNKGEFIKQKTVHTELQSEPVAYEVFGKHLIDEFALKQMDAAMRLPVTVAGALMPDAHVGYGLPIGGVLATRPNIIIPYAVGVDIACRMCLSVFDMPEDLLFKEDKLLKRLLNEHTYFGVGAETKVKHDDSLFERPEWAATKTLRSLRDKAHSQLGTSGSGNHFVEWGYIEVMHRDELLQLPPGKYLALLSHSGSRGFGGKIASAYSSIAMEKTRLPEGAKHLAWLELDTEEGQEYWLSMNLAGDYASANHHEIHNKIAKALRQKPIGMVENHHNFAWKETLPDGREVMVHRKGATPAGEGVLGIIPGSMTAPGFVVKGKAEKSSLASASHGAGRVLSRKKAIRELDRKEVKAHLEKAGVQLMGAGLDEAPMVYKNIHEVMLAQDNLIETLAAFHPKIVRMADSKEPAED